MDPKSVSTSFRVREAPKNLLKYTTNALGRWFRILFPEKTDCDQNGERVSKNDESCHICIRWLKSYLSTSSLIRPSYTIGATIFENMFWLEKFPKTEYFPTRRIISLFSRTCKFASRTCKLYSLLESIILVFFIWRNTS